MLSRREAQIETLAAVCINGFVFSPILFATFQDFKTASYAKISRDEVYARKLVEGTHYHKKTTISPTAGVIWELKEEPGWD